MLNDFISLLYPKICTGCGTVLSKNETVICTGCWLSLPVTNFHKDSENLLMKLFWGRVQLEYGTTQYEFTKGGILQNLIHGLKYKGEVEIGKLLGVELGKSLKMMKNYHKPDLIIPMPLHPKKFKVRGYNQCDSIAEGVSLALESEVNKEILYRESYNESQTKKGRYDRWVNVAEIFKVNTEQVMHLESKHILLIDDVLTTGATVESAVIALKKIPEVKVSLGTLAMGI